jgi:hypothetical protein
MVHTSKLMALAFSAGLEAEASSMLKTAQADR